MKKINREDIRGTSPEGTKNVNFKPLIADNFDPPHFHMRLFEIAPGGHTPRHAHEWEHEIFVISGSGKLVLQGGVVSLSPGDAVFIKPHELHQFVSSGDSDLDMICVIPRPSGGDR